MPRLSAFIVLSLLLAGAAFAQDDYVGKTFRITGSWSGAELRASRIQLREDESDAQRVRLSGRIESIDVSRSTLRIGPLAIEWNENTQFEGIAVKQLANDLPLRVSARAASATAWTATKIERERDNWPRAEAQITGVAQALQRGGAGAQRIAIATVPVQLAGAGYNRVESLTRRQDSRRPDQPSSVNVAGRPLSITGEYNLAYRKRENFRLDDTRRSDLTQEAQIELFYPYSDNVFFFAEAKGFDERDLRRSDGGNRDIDTGIKRGETWVFFNGLARGHLGLQLGRQNFKETRDWWWDDDLDAARLYVDRGALHAEFALARELARESTDDEGIDPSEKGVYRAIAQASWLWASRQAVELYAMRRDDRSSQPAVGSTLRASEEDATDAKLMWLGLRALGQRSLNGRGNLKYWADAAWLRGKDTSYDFSDAGSGSSAIDRRSTRDVRAHAFDVGVSWQLPLKWRPALSVGYARGSGDNGNGTVDRNFRQTGLQGNKARFFGVNRFRYYGELLRPELSNLGVTTLAFGVPFFNNSSVELVHHRYRQAKPSEQLRDVRIDADLTGNSRDIGSEIDVIFGFRDLARWDFALIASRFKAGEAFGAGAGKSAYLWLIEATYNF